MSVTPVDSGTPSSKRNSKMAAGQSLNHLLNFSLPPRQSQQPQSLPRRRKPTTNAAVWSRERFVNAQYRFVMSPSGDYTVHFADPDIYFNWPDVLQVVVPRTSALVSAAGSSNAHRPDEGVTHCPICLSPPTAPRMTRCGHIFCFPCILHYLNTSDNSKWARCPICHDSVNEKSLKAVKWIDSPTIEEEDDNAAPTASSSSATVDNAMAATPRPGSLLRMRLIQRLQITTLALPRSSSWPSDLLPLHQAPFHFMPDVMTFSRFMLATPASLIADLTQDIDDLATEKRMLSSMHDDLGIIFVDAAEQKVRHQMAKAAALETPQLKQAVEAAHNALRRTMDQAAYISRKLQAAKEQAPTEEAPTEFLASRPIAHNVPPHATGTLITPGETQPRNAKQRRNVNPPVPPPSYYYYQAASGSPIFLHPLDIKILLTNFKTYSAFPDTITVRVESCAEGSVNGELRKRCKYLSHFPDSADVVFIETDLEGVVGPETLKNFEKALTNRRARRKEKERKDDRARARAEQQEKERVVQNWNEMTRHRPDAYIPPPRARSPSPVPDFNDFPEPVREPQPAAPARQQTAAPGAWGAQSFASAAQRPSGSARGSQQRQAAARRAEREYEADEWDLDLAFHALEQRAGNRGGGGKRKGAKMVVLGGGGGRQR